MFVECISLGTRQTNSLPSAILKTLGKKKHSAKRGVCRVSNKKHSANMGFTECHEKTLGKKGGLPSVQKQHSAKQKNVEKKTHGRP